MESVVPSAPLAGHPRPPYHRGGSRRGRDERAFPSTSGASSQPTGPTPPVHSPALEVAGRSRSAPNKRGGTRGRQGGLGRGGREARRGGPRPLQPSEQRPFGGQLTSNSPPTRSAAGSLSGDAAVFVPGRPVVPQPQRQQARSHPRRLSKSHAPDIASRIHEDITNRQYECVICTNEVLANSKIWSCRTCWSVLHLSCVKRWSKNEVATHQQRADENGELPPLRQWRCPGCNLPKDTLPGNYTCWCEKEVEPHWIAGIPPHSCGQTCSKQKGGRCPHPCNLICHAGPCPPCSLMGPSITCHCGKESASRKCQDTNYDCGWSCGQVCGDNLACGEHTCQRGCHEGLCGACETLMDSRCYCGKKAQPMPCFERDEECLSQSASETWTGSFNCGLECRRQYDCANPDHFCRSPCHVQTAEPAHCPLSPDVVKSCPCGKTPLSCLLPTPREHCSDPIPRCKEKCEKALFCGHLCRDTCHEGNCKPCEEILEVSCRCGRTSSRTECHLRTEEPPTCTRICRSSLNCGRHECGAMCCSGEKKAAERQAARRGKVRSPRQLEEVIEAEHICLKICGRPLKCGSHFCQELCHKGSCSSCLEAVFDEISCSCGRTVLQPPQPCGTKPPTCVFECIQQRNCGHPQVKHQCHSDNEPCPKCPFLVEKTCICGKKLLKNQPCWFTEVRCGLPCGKKLKCGIHTCQKLCHRVGQCEDATTPCKQLCGRQKTVCDHTCAESCHAPYPCKQNSPCQAKTFATCPCQHQKQAMKCLASKSSEGNSTKTLECNDECLKLQRNANLAAAFNIDLETHSDGHIPYSKTTLDLFAATPKTSQVHERETRVFAADENQKRLRFKPMKAHERAFLHALAEDFGLDSESQDPEPHRHVCIFKTPRFVSAPMKTLSQCMALRQTTTNEPSTTAAKSVNLTIEPLNAFLLVKPKFALTIDELEAELGPEFSAAGLNLDVAFLRSGEVMLKAMSSSGSQKLETMLISVKASVVRKIVAKGLGESVTLCHVDSSLKISRKEDDHAGGGWSQVAKGSLASKVVPQPAVGMKSSFTVLGTKGLKKVKKEIAEEAVDDWERQVEDWDNAATAIA